MSDDEDDVGISESWPLVPVGQHGIECCRVPSVPVLLQKCIRRANGGDGEAHDVLLRLRGTRT